MSSMTNNAILLLVCLASTCYARRVVDAQFMDAESQPANPSLAAVLSALQLAYQPAQRSMPRSAGVRTGAKALNVRMADEPETMTEEEYLAQLEAEKDAEMAQLMEDDPEMAEKIARIERGMKSSKTGAVLAPWMKVDARAQVEEERRKENQARQWEMNKNVIDESIVQEGLSLNQISQQSQEVEMRWPRLASYSEQFLGFIVQKRNVMTDGNWETVASYDSVKQLRADRGADGCKFTEEDVPVGENEYRILGFQEDGRKIALWTGKITVEAPKIGIGGYIAIALFIIVFLALFIYGDQDNRIYQ